MGSSSKESKPTLCFHAHTCDSLESSRSRVFNSGTRAMLDHFGSLFMCNSCFSRCTCAQIHVLVHAYEYVHEIHVQYALITVHAIHDVLS